MSALERVGALGRRREFPADCGGNPQWSLVVGRWSLVVGRLVGYEAMGLTNDE